MWALILELAEYERLSHLVSGSAVALREQLFGNRPFVYCLVAERDGEVVGYAIYFLNFSTFLTRPGVWLEDVYVTPSCRGTGLGKALLTAVTEEARRMGSGRLEWAVLDWNQPAIDFYRAFGAEVMPDWRVCRISF